MIARPVCPLCKKPTVVEFRPFCSKRCADIDLARWLGEYYRIEGETTPDTHEEVPEE